MPVPPPALSEPAGEKGIMTSIAELLTTGEAWASDLDDLRPLHTPAVTEAYASVVIAEPLPAPATIGVPIFAPRVQLGFRDGTSTTLEPGSDQFRALEELAQSLTRRD